MLEEMVKRLLPGEEITTAQAVMRYGHDISHYRSLAASGQVAARKVGRDWLLDVQSLEDYLDAPHRRGPKPLSRAERMVWKPEDVEVCKEEAR